jgi:hypothetical protein
MGKYLDLIPSTSPLFEKTKANYFANKGRILQCSTRVQRHDLAINLLFAKNAFEVTAGTIVE